jgi:hypothetical protein
MIKKSKLIFIFVVFSLLLVNNANAQCVVPNFDVPICIVVGDTVTFANQSIDNNCAPCTPYGPNYACGAWQATTYDWFIYDSNNSFITYDNNYNLTFSFSNSGTYSIQLEPDIPGSNWKCCPNTSNSISPSVRQKYITVVDSILSINSNDSISICDGGGIDTADINLQINHNVGAVNFLWTALPSGDLFPTINPLGIDPNDTEIELTITDLATGCTASKTIIMSITTTNIDAGFTSYYLNSVSAFGCATDSIVFTANDSTNTNINWSINTQSIGTTSTIITDLSSYISNNTFVNVSLTVLDTIAGCYVSSDTDFVFSAPPFIALDTSILNQNLPTFYDTINHGFNGCNTSSGFITLSFENSNFTIGNQNIDSLVFSWPDSTTSILTDSSLAAFLSNGSISNTFALAAINTVFTVTVFNSDGCSYSVPYNILAGGSSETNIIAVGLSFIGSTLCSDTSSWFYMTNPFSLPLPNEPIISIGPNDKVTWTVFCDLSSTPFVPVFEIEWNAVDYLSNFSILPNGDSAVIFQYTFPSNSCLCQTINGDNAYSVYVDVDKFCDPAAVIGASQSVKIEDPPIAKFNANSACKGENVIFNNNTEVGCDGITVNTQLDTTLIFQWDFGDCNDTITMGIYPFPGTQHQYALAGEYWAKLTVDATCGTSYDSSLIVINQLPNVSFDADPVCLGQKTIFNNYSSTASASTRIENCYFPPRVINVPAGGNITSWEWIIDPTLTNQLDQHNAWDAIGEFLDINGGPITDIDDQLLAFQFDSCGTYPVWLRVTDDNGCDSTYRFDVIVYDLPEPNFTVSEVCQGTCTPIDDSSYVIRLHYGNMKFIQEML